MNSPIPVLFKRFTMLAQERLVDHDQITRVVRASVSFELQKSVYRRLKAHSIHHHGRH